MKGRMCCPLTFSEVNQVVFEQPSIKSNERESGLYTCYAGPIASPFTLSLMIKKVENFPKYVFCC